jgi:hypothetical protein
MRRYLFAVSIALAAATATVATASSRDRERGRGREHAEDDHHDGEHRRGGDHPRELGSVDPTYVKECGACHVAYPPAMLPATAWRSILSGLDRHFGQNAELGPEVRAQLESFAVSSAGPDGHGTGSSMRITEQDWFRDEHDDVPQGAVARPEIRTMANCSACHPGAESWDFDDDRVKIPRG